MTEQTSRDFLQPRAQATIPTGNRSTRLTTTEIPTDIGNLNQSTNFFNSITVLILLLTPYFTGELSSEGSAHAPTFPLNPTGERSARLITREVITEIGNLLKIYSYSSRNT